MSGMPGAGIPVPSRRARWTILGLVGAVFAIPLVAMLEFTLRRGLEGGYDLSRWAAVLTGSLGPEYRVLGTAIGNSLVLAAATVAIVLVLLVPTMIVVHLRLPRLRPVLEFVCLLPISIPAIVLVVGLAPVYGVIARAAGSGVWSLAFAYGILVLPFAYRAVQSNLDAVDVATLTEAARSLGASWPVVIARVLLPNLRPGLLAGAFITVAVVLGEFTIASLLNRQNLQTALVIVQKDDPFIAVIVALLALFLALALLLVIGRLGRIRSGRTP
ncbi:MULTISPECIES: ABC transporter permease [unclassified Microcella]|uniref:ABC transporter permease n=1 Tax=unclassified Microcella TaxID=2630066 RepID=UPI0006F9D1A6|nr:MULTISPECIES: ABC transporter permease subunit [unclassified Microcella]KQV26868.1 ABC transporter permease [Yonghaparkia sp. Root332]KRF33805.1 ABC transporter permease [Yonghaparkia sp. Soil809]